MNPAFVRKLVKQVMKYPNYLCTILKKNDYRERELFALSCLRTTVFNKKISYPLGFRIISPPVPIWNNLGDKSALAMHFLQEDKNSQPPSTD